MEEGSETVVEVRKEDLSFREGLEDGGLVDAVERAWFGSANTINSISQSKILKQ